MIRSSSKEGGARIAAQAPGGWPGHRHLAAGAFFPPRGAARPGRRDRLQSRESGGATPGSRGPAPAASRPAAAGGPSSALHPPARLPPPSSSLARSLPRAGSALTPPHAAAAAGRWRGTTAARCWMKSSRPSSSTISLTRRYGPAGSAGRGPRVQSRGAAAAAAEAGAQRWAHRGDRGVQAAEPPFHVPCAALRYRRSELQVAGACCSIGGHSHPGGSGQGYLESTVPPPAKLRGTAIPWVGGIWPGSEGPLRLALGAVGASSAPSTCCRTFTCTCGGGKGGGPQPWSPLVLQHRVPQVLPLVFPQPPTCSRSAEFPVTCRLGELRGLRGTWTCGRR